MMRTTSTTQSGRVARIIGLGADAADGHIRFTQGHDYEVVFGSEHSHALMQQWCEGIQQRLREMDKQLHELTEEEFLALARKAAPSP